MILIHTKYTNNILYSNLMKKAVFFFIIIASFTLTSCDTRTDENTIYGNVYYENNEGKEIVGACSLKIYKAEETAINLVTAKPTYTTTANTKGYYEFKRKIPDGAWWLVTSVNYIDTTEPTRIKRTYQEIVDLYELSKNTKKEVDIHITIK